MSQIVIFDWKRTLYDPDNKILIAGAEELLSYLQKKGIQLILIGKGGQDMYGEVERLRISHYFAHILFEEGKKSIDQFKQFVISDPQDTCFVGDRVRSELEVGNSLGCVTIWVKQGKFASEEPMTEGQQPKYTVGSLYEVMKLL